MHTHKAQSVNKSVEPVQKVKHEEKKKEQIKRNKHVNE